MGLLSWLGMALLVLGATRIARPRRGLVAAAFVVAAVWSGVSLATASRLWPDQPGEAASVLLTAATAPFSIVYGMTAISELSLRALSRPEENRFATSYNRERFLPLLTRIHGWWTGVPADSVARR